MSFYNHNDLRLEDASKDVRYASFTLVEVAKSLIW